MKLLRTNRATGNRELREVNPAVLQDMVDFLFSRNVYMAFEDMEGFDRRRRRWAMEIDNVPQPAPPPVTVSAAPVKRGPGRPRKIVAPTIATSTT